MKVDTEYGYTKEEEVRSVCPDCWDNNHHACTGASWSRISDGPAICSCWERNHDWRLVS